ncbi:nuclear transport factor 2 family protein [Thermodesulfobacteriota bacterium]
MNTRPKALLLVLGIAAVLIAGVNPFQVWAEKKVIPPGSITLEARVKKLEDLEEIRQRIMDYGRFLDQRDFKSFSELFAKTKGEWIGGMGRAKGSQAIRELMESTIGKNTSMTQSLHLFTNESIHVNGDQARAVTKWIFMVTGESNRPELYFVGHYEDTMIRENGRWKFLRRVVHADIPTDGQISTNKPPEADK